MSKKPVHSSHLSLRFYKHDGWSKEILDKYITRGRVVDISPNQAERDYWFLDHTEGSRLDMKRLLENEVSRLHRWYEGSSLALSHHETDLEYMEGMNW